MPPQAETTRQNQLDQKAGTVAEEQASGRGGRGRGRGRGRGGRKGRGRGLESIDDSKAKEEKEKAKRKGDTGSGDAKNVSKRPKNKHSPDDDWAAWGSYDAWSQGWYDDTWDAQAWAWDSYAYYAAESSKYDLQQAKAKSSTGASGASGSKKKTPQQTPKNIDDVKDEPAPRKVDAKKDNKDTNKGKKRPKNEPNEAEVAPSERKNRHVCGSVFRTPLPATKKDRHQEVMDFLKSFKTMPEDAATKLMRGRLHDVACCRLNVYYNRPAVGLHCRVDKRDIAYFRAASTDCPYVFRLASSMKAAEMMVPCLHLHLHI